MPAVQTGRGFNQYELYDVFNTLRTKILALLAALDADDGVADTDYVALLTFSWDTKFRRVAVRDQSFWLDSMDKLRTSFNGLLAKLDDDGSITDTDYESTLAIADYTNVRTTADLINAGMQDGAVVKWLDTYITNYQAALVKIDADLGDTTYAVDHTAGTLVNASGARLKVA